MWECCYVTLFSSKDLTGVKGEWKVAVDCSPPVALDFLCDDAVLIPRTARVFAF